MSSKPFPTLRPCPFCGATGDDVQLVAHVVKYDGDEVETGYEVECVNCGGSVGDEYEDVTVNLWNGKGAVHDYDLEDEEASS